jgi:hypothetical protein
MEVEEQWSIPETCLGTGGAQDDQLTIGSNFQPTLHR